MVYKVTLNPIIYNEEVLTNLLQCIFYIEINKYIMYYNQCVYMCIKINIPKYVKVINKTIKNV